jgi:hypothetical protein
MEKRFMDATLTRISQPKDSRWPERIEQMGSLPSHYLLVAELVWKEQSTASQAFTFGGG